MRRIGCFIGIFLLFLIAANIVAYKAFGTLWRESGGPPWPVRIIFVIVFTFVVISVLSRSFRRTAAPIGDVMDAADRVAAGDYDVRVEPRGTGEVRQLAVSFNEMTARLHANEEQRRHLLADVAHELRTPLAVVRGNLEGMLDGVYPRDDAQLTAIIEQTAHMTRLLEDLRTLSLVEAGTLNLFPEPTDLGELIADVVAAFRAKADAAGIALTASTNAVPEIDVDPTRLREVFENLVANSLRYTPANGSIRINGSASETGVTITVADTGAGIAQNILPVLFQRFAKSADSGGSGLGLAIAKRLIDAHGGTIVAESELGQGTTIRIWLPATRS
jgi:signal transduction histidine kinase